MMEELLEKVLASAVLSPPLKGELWRAYRARVLTVRVLGAECGRRGTQLRLMRDESEVEHLGGIQSTLLIETSGQVAR